MRRPDQAPPTSSSCDIVGRADAQAPASAPTRTSVKRNRRRPRRRPHHLPHRRLAPVELIRRHRPARPSRVREREESGERGQILLIVPSRALRERNRASARAKPSTHCHCCRIWPSLFDGPVARCARRRPYLAPPRPGTADIIIVRHRRSPRPPELQRRPEPESLKRNRRRPRRRPHHLPPRRLAPVEQIRRHRPARPSRARENNK